MDKFEEFMNKNRDKIYKYIPKWEDFSLQEKLDYLDITEDQLSEKGEVNNEK